MTFDSQHFFRNISPSKTLHIIVIDDSQARVHGCGKIDIQYFKLKDVLHIPSLSNYFNFVRKFIEDNSFAVIFF